MEGNFLNNHAKYSYYYFREGARASMIQWLSNSAVSNSSKLLKSVTVSQINTLQMKKKINFEQKYNNYNMSRVIDNSQKYHIRHYINKISFSLVKVSIKFV